MKTPRKHESDGSVDRRFIDIEEARLVADLRIMHSRVNELYQLIINLKRRHHETAVREYADRDVLEEDIRRVDEIYLWFVHLKEEGLRIAG